MKVHDEAGFCLAGMSHLLCRALQRLLYHIVDQREIAEMAKQSVRVLGFQLSKRDPVRLCVPSVPVQKIKLTKSMRKERFGKAYDGAFVSFKGGANSPRKSQVMAGSAHPEGGREQDLVG